MAEKLSLSVGYSMAKEHPDIQIEKLIHLADERMYEAKAEFYMQPERRRRKVEEVERKEKEYIDIISALASDITGLYVIDSQIGEVTVYRLSASDHRMRSGVPLEQGFESAMETFIDRKVYPDDREMMRNSIQLDFIKEELAEKDTFIVHFRTMKDGAIHYHYMKCMKNVAQETFQKIIISFCPEDNMIRLKEKAASLSEIEIDDLTDIYTKQAFMYHAKVVLDNSNSLDDTFTIIISDIQNFKIYNSIYGEKGGDELLKDLAGDLMGTCNSGHLIVPNIDKISHKC